MKKRTTLTFVGIILLILASLAFLVAWQRFILRYQEHWDLERSLEPLTFISGDYVSGAYEGGYVWAGAMNLAWNELNENILHEKLQLNTRNKHVLKIVDKLNNAPFSKNDLDEKSYYIKSGYGQSTVDEINRGVKKKFPSKNFKDLQIKLGPRDIISYAYFAKDVQYKTEFEKSDVLFNETTVKGFIAKSEAQKENVKILKYDNDDKFIIKLQLKDDQDELILAKGYDMTSPQKIVDIINKNNKTFPPAIEENDNFEAPQLHLNYRHDYTELIGLNLANHGFKNYYIAQMFENIKFNMDEKGAKVENEAVIAVPLAAAPGDKEPKYRNFILDKPYWVIMKRKNSKHPYFILGLNNTKLMEIQQ